MCSRLLLTHIYESKLNEFLVYFLVQPVIDTVMVQLAKHILKSTFLSLSLIKTRRGHVWSGVECTTY